MTAFLILYLVMGVASGVLWYCADEGDSPELVPVLIAFWPLAVVGVAVIAAVDTWGPVE